MSRKKRKPSPPPAPPSGEEESAAPEPSGWNAITAAFARLYPEQPKPPHFAPTLPPPLSGDGLIYGISAYHAEGPPHWHMVTYGFSDLYDNQSDDPDVSGWGFELTFRLARLQQEDRPPNWAINFLINLGRYVQRSRNPFGPGHWMDLNGPIADASETAIRAIAFADDPQVEAIDTPNGKVEFLQVVGITFDEFRTCGDWTPGGLLGILREADPRLVTDLARRSVLENPAIAARVQAGIDQEGSSTSRGYVSVVNWSVVQGPAGSNATITLGAKGADDLLRKLRSRLLHDRDFWLMGPDKMVVFAAADANAWRTQDNALLVDLTKPAIRAMLGSLQALRGTYRWQEFPGLVLEVVPSEIRDPQGQLIQVIG